MNFKLAHGLQRPARIAVFLAVAVAATALATLVGWQSGIAPLKSIIAGSLSMQPATAIALSIGAAGLGAAAMERRWASTIVAWVLLAGCALWLWADVAHVALSSDLALFRAQVLAQNPAPMWRGRPSIITCVAIALFAGALLGVRARSLRLRQVASGAANLGLLLASLAVLPLALHDPLQLSVLNQSLRIALNTALAAGALCSGVLVLMRDNGWAWLVSGEGEQARIGRLLAPIALIPVAAAMVANTGVRLGYYGPDVRMLLVIELSAVALLVLATWAARTLSRERQERDSLANALARSTVMIVDGHGRLRHWPPACEALYGWTAAEVLGRRPGEFLNVEGASVREKTRAAIREHGEWRGEIEHWTKAGDRRWVALQWVLRKGVTDSEDRVVGTVSDITDLKLAEASLRESQERLTLALGAYALGIGDTDVASDQFLADEGLERIFGVGPGGMNGPVTELRARLLIEDLSATVGQIDAAVAARLPSQVDGLRIRRPDGEIRDLHGSRRFFYSPQGVHERTIGVYRDVTDELRAQEELAQRGDRLAELRAELAQVARLSTMSEMAAALAHELNQPLTAIGNSVGALKIMLGDGGTALNDSTRALVVRAANQAEGQAVRAGEIVRRLRDFIARGEADARIEDLDSLIEEAVTLAAPAAGGEQVEVRLNLSPQASQVLADRIQIQQILLNLIRNATEAMGDSPALRIITLSTTAKRGMAEVSVSDSGPGVMPELAKRLFSPFLSTKTAGMGVGLSICRRIVEAHGGRMWLEQSEAGADFRFTIPLIAEELRHAE
jgi:two-component system sensor kinase FixL